MGTVINVKCAKCAHASVILILVLQLIAKFELYAFIRENKFDF